MTLTVESAFQWNSTQVENEYIGPRDQLQGTRSTKSDRARPSFSANSCEVLLEDPVFALWAAEAAVKYSVRAADALELLAYALFLDGEM
jgi:hypothetical protein